MAGTQLLEAWSARVAKLRTPRTKADFASCLLADDSPEVVDMGRKLANTARNKAANQREHGGATARVWKHEHNTIKKEIERLQVRWKPYVHSDSVRTTTAPGSGKETAFLCIQPRMLVLQQCNSHSLSMYFHFCSDGLAIACTLASFCFW
jgi:hypothetical protein